MTDFLVVLNSRSVRMIVLDRFLDLTGYALQAVVRHKPFFAS